MHRTALTLLGVLLLMTFLTAADDLKPVAKAAPDPLVGTWKLVSAKYGGQDFTFPEGYTVLKHVTPVQFNTLIFDKDGKVVRSAGGSYQLEGEKYVETPEYSTSENFDNIRNKPQAFQCKIEGKKWNHSGTLTNGQEIEEVYERVDRK